jgi:hypothetical protein
VPAVVSLRHRSFKLRPHPEHFSALGRSAFRPVVNPVSRAAVPVPSSGLPIPFRSLVAGVALPAFYSASDEQGCRKLRVAERSKSGYNNR